MFSVHVLPIVRSYPSSSHNRGLDNSLTFRQFQVAEFQIAEFRKEYNSTFIAGVISAKFDIKFKHNFRMKGAASCVSKHIGPI